MAPSRVNNQVSKQPGSLNAASQRLRPPSVARVYRDEDDDDDEGAKKCFKLVQNVVC